MIWKNNFIWYPYFENSLPLDKPPTLFTILNAHLNYGKDERVKIKDIAKMSTDFVFDFDYPVSEFLDKKTFETAWINHFLQRRIGTETFTSFQLHLMAKMNEIMPYYNLLFDNLGEKFSLWTGDGYTLTVKEDNNRSENSSETAESSGTTTTETATETINDNRYSDTPQNHLENIQSGEYVTDYRYDTANAESNGETNAESEETKDRTATAEEDKNKIEIKTSTTAHRIEDIIKYMAEAEPIMTKIYRDCDSLFYQLF